MYQQVSILYYMHYIHVHLIIILYWRMLTVMEIGTLNQQRMFLGILKSITPKIWRFMNLMMMMILPHDITQRIAYTHIRRD